MILKYLKYFIIFVILQNIVNYFTGCYCSFIYIGGLICSPWTGKHHEFFIFKTAIIGFVVDVIYSTTSIHTMTLVALTYLKHYMISLIVPKNVNYIDISINDQGIAFVSFIDIALVLLYHLLVFTIYKIQNIFSPLSLYDISIGFMFSTFTILFFHFAEYTLDIINGKRSN